MLQKILQSISDVFYPNICPLCATGLIKEETGICNSCLIQLPYTHFKLDQNNVAYDKFIGRVPIEAATALTYFTKESKMQTILHLLKYKDREDIGEALGHYWAASQKEEFVSISAIMPVPLSKKRQFERGYNQSESIANGMASNLNIPVLRNLLQRNKITESQTHKTRLERLENMENAFEVIAFNSLENHHILLLDDVLTTGATLEACALTLLKANPNCKISIASLAIAIQ